MSHTRSDTLRKKKLERPRVGWMEGICAAVPEMFTRRGKRVDGWKRVIVENIEDI
jgi:hypothetical protein